MEQPTVAILGASENREKFGNKSVRAHLQAGYRVYPVNHHGKPIEGQQTFSQLADIPDPLDRISVYLAPAILLEVLEEIAATPHQQLWLNPGTESEAVVHKARTLGLDPIFGCSIVDLGVDPRTLTES